MERPDPCSSAPLWICPLCSSGLALNVQGKSWFCSNGHSFDCAREGYVNLLPSNKKHSKVPGDSAGMIAARRQVHGADIYRPLSDAILARFATLQVPTRIVELGCGEGYYSNALQQAIPAAQVCAVDISKAAVRMAAKQYPGVAFAVASTFKLPLASNSQDFAVRIFAPCQDSELARVLRPGGYYLEVTPAPRHLWVLREALYHTPRPHEESRQSIAGLVLCDSGGCEYEVELNRSLLVDLLAMTPFAHRGHREGREKLQQLDTMAVGMAFTLNLFQKPPVT